MKKNLQYPNPTRLAPGGVTPNSIMNSSNQTRLLFFSKLRIRILALAAGIALTLAGTAQAQTIATLGATTPTPGANDISQLDATGNQQAPDGLNYYDNNATPIGQTFTTLGNSSGYILASVAFKSGTAGTSGTQSGDFTVGIYSISGATATLITNYDFPSFSFAPGDWVQVSGLTIPLNATTTYAYSFKYNDWQWDNMDVASGNPYAGGEIALIPSAGGTITTGASHDFDAQFDIGLGLQGGPPVVGTPTATPNPCYALSPVVLTAISTPAAYQWQTNSDISGGMGGAWVNISGATSLTITNFPPDYAGVYVLDYRLVATSGSLSTTSAPVGLTVSQASAPTVSVDTTPAGPILTRAGATLTLTAAFGGTTPITNQWQTDVGQTGTFTNIPDQTTGTLTITNLQVANAGNYRLQASNVKGAGTSTPVQVKVVNVLWSENFNCPTQPDQPISNVGWRNDVRGSAGNTRIFTGNGGVTYPNNAVFSWPGGPEAYYATTATANGGPYAGGTITNKQALPLIDLATVQNLTFGADLNSAYNPTLTHAYIAVQMNFGQWYSSTTELLPQPTSTTFVTDTLPFNSDFSAWNLLTVSGNGSVNNASYPAIGASAGSGPMTGYITGVGIVIIHDNASTLQFDNFVVLGAPHTDPCPQISSQPSSVTNYTGTTATFSVTANTNGSTEGLSYQWQTNTAVGSGTWANLSNGGQFSGVNTKDLTIASVSTAANHKDYRVIVTDAACSKPSSNATLTVIDSEPIPTSSTSIYPDDAPDFGTANATNRVGNNNTLHLTASFVGNLPMHFQWSVSPNADGSSATNILGATNSTLTLSNLQPSFSGYYTVTVTNSQSVTPTNSGLAQLTVLPADPTLIQWSAPVVINGLTAAQFLYGVPGTYIGAESFGAPTAITVTNGGTEFLFDNTGAVATAPTPRLLLLSYTGPSTGDTNLDTVLGVGQEELFTSTVTVNNLTVGQLYSVQLVALNDTAGNTRPARWSDPLDTSAADFSPAFLMGDNVYVVGTFVANSTTETITDNEVSGGYVSCVIVRTGKPTMTLAKSGSSWQITWNFGTLLESTNVAGPYTQTAGTTTGPSSYTVVPTGPAKFYRVSFP